MSNSIETAKGIGTVLIGACLIASIGFIGHFPGHTAVDLTLKYMSGSALFLTGIPLLAYGIHKIAHVWMDRNHKKQPGEISLF